MKACSLWCDSDYCHRSVASCHCHTSHLTCLIYYRIGVVMGGAQCMRVGDLDSSLGCMS